MAQIDRQESKESRILSTRRERNARAGMRISIAMLFALACPTGSAEADERTVASCDGFILGYDGQPKQKKCFTEDLSKGRAEGSLSEIEIHDDQYYLVAFYDQAKFQSY